jgi:GalNAc-alpha-(1->4)-GalNAc-alpha-(1->3)-diNAcBac-PP-undecaprenol alpha-1,4-N-acetyl-D-galactosaminyltransferase
VSSNNRKRIVFVATDLSTGGGVNRVIRDLSGLFAEQLGADVCVVAARSEAQPSYPFAPTVRLEFGKSGGIWSYVRQLWRIRRSAPDYVIGSWTQDNIVLLAVFMFSRTKVVVAEHCSWSFHGPFVRALRRLFYPFAYSVIALNPTDHDHYSQRLPNVELIPNPVEVPPSSRRQREKLVIAVGHLEPVKNFTDAISAMAASGLDAQGWTLAIIGSGSRQHELTEFAREHGLKNFSIEQSVTNLPDWYARASLILVTSVSEVFSLVLAEAMAARVIPVAYATDGPRFLLADFPEHLVGIGDDAAMAKRMAQFASADDHLRDELRSSIEARFSPASIVEQWHRVLA